MLALFFTLLTVYASHEEVKVDWVGPEPEPLAWDPVWVEYLQPVNSQVAKNGAPDKLTLVFSFADENGKIMRVHVGMKSKAMAGSSLWTYKARGYLNEEEVDFASFLFPKKNLDAFEGVVSSDGHYYRFKPADRVQQDKATRAKSHLGKKFALKQGTVVGIHRNVYETNEQHRRRLQDVKNFEGEIFADCWEGQSTTIKQVEIGYVVDPDYVANAIEQRQATDGCSDKECVEAEVFSTNELTNGIYNHQMSVVISVGHIIDQGGLFSEQMTSSFQLGCHYDISTYLSTFAQWRTSNKNSQYGIWKLLTNCYPPPGTIGLAYVGTLCREYACGVTTWTADTSYGGTWHTNAHEIGHIFGAGHSFENGQGSTGGIMDYGDGKIGGIYQFNQLRKDEVCGTIRNTFSSSRVPECWKTLGVDPTPAPTFSPTPNPTEPAATNEPTGNPTPLPTPLPTPQPTHQPTFQPSTSTAEPTTTLEPTNAAVVTKHPTHFPTTPSPTTANPTTKHPTGPPTETPPGIINVDDNDVYEWVKGSIGDCLPDEGSYRWRTSTYTCYHKDSNGNVISQEADEKCDLGNRPIFANTHYGYKCNSVSVSTVCGDGILEDGEECEPSLHGEACCLASTCKWSTADSCTGSNPQVDAGFINQDGEMYLFQGDQIFKYDSMEATEVSVGYPRSIITVLPGLVAAVDWQSDIDAALMRPGETILYIFKGLDYIMYDMSNDVVRYTKSMASYVSPSFSSCGKIMAALALQGEQWFFCESVFNVLPYGGSFSHFRPVHDLYMDWNVNITTHISAAVHNHATGKSIFWNGNERLVMVGRTPQGEPMVQPGLGGTVPEGAETIVCADNCLECKSPTSCTKCSSKYVLMVRHCWPENFFTYIDWNVHQTNNMGQEYIAGGQSSMQALEDDGNLVPGLVSGGSTDDGLALHLDGNTRVNMKALNQKWDKLIIEAYFKPDDLDIPSQRFVTFTDGKEDKISIWFTRKVACAPAAGCECKEVTTALDTIPARCGYHILNDTNTVSDFAFCYVEEDGTCNKTESEFVGSQGEYWAECPDFECSDYGSDTGRQFELEVLMPSGLHYACFVEEPLQSQSWNKLKLIISDTIIRTGVNGVYHERGFEEIGTADAHFTIRDWYIGDENEGLVGTLDKLMVRIEGAQSDTSSDDDSNLTAILLGVLIPAFCICCLVVFCCVYREQLEDYMEERKKNKGVEMGGTSMPKTGSSNETKRHPGGVPAPPRPPGRPGQRMAPPSHNHPPRERDSEVGMWEVKM